MLSLLLTVLFDSVFEPFRQRIGFLIGPLSAVSCNRLTVQLVGAFRLMVNIRTIMPSKLLNFVNIRSDIRFDSLHGAGCDTISIRVMGFLQLMLCAKFF